MRWWRVVVPVAATALALAATESYLRYHDTQPDARFRMADDQRGWVLRPGFAGWTSDEARQWVEINSDGLRDRERPLAKPAGTRRVAVLGDSYMEAFNVPFEKTFVSFLREGLAACGQSRGWQPDVLNFGVGGYGTAQELLTYRLHARKYRPDIVVLAVYTSNDIANNHPLLNPASSRGIAPYFKLEDGELRFTPPDRDAVARASRPPTPPAPDPALPWYQRARVWLTERLLTAHYTYAAYARLRNPAQHQETAPSPEASSTIDGEEAIYLEPVDPIMKEAWAVTEALVLALARDVAADGGEFWLTTLSNAEQVHPDPARRLAVARERGAPDLLYPDRRLAAHAARNGLPVITLVEPLMEHASRYGTFLNGGYSEDAPLGDGHWNETANALAGRTVATRLCRDSAAAR